MNCPECDERMGVVKTMVLGTVTKRLQECPCGVRVETEEKVIRRLPSVYLRHGQPARNGPSSAGNPPVTTGGVGGGVSSGSDPSLIPYPHSNPDPDQTRARRKPRAKVDYTHDFEVFWQRWPRRVAKDEAAKAWSEAVSKAPGLVAVIHAALEWQVPEFEAREPKARPHAATWLRGRRWLDEKPAPASAQAVLPAKVQQSRDAIMEWVNR